MRHEQLTAFSFLTAVLFHGRNFWKWFLPCIVGYIVDRINRKKNATFVSQVRLYCLLQSSNRLQPTGCFLPSAESGSIFRFLIETFFFRAGHSNSTQGSGGHPGSVHEALVDQPHAGAVRLHQVSFCHKHGVYDASICQLWILLMNQNCRCYKFSH
jgi:hypothetical protein